MAYPVMELIKPSDLAGLTNGKLPDSILTSHVFPGYTQPARAHRNAMRAWKALAAAVKHHTGVILTITSLGDAYRNYQQQYTTFFARYTTSNTGRSSKIFNGTRYYLKAGMAMAAVPGTSNHGWGLAFDTAAYMDGKRVYLAGTKAFPWMLANADDFGIGWEAQSEPWHVRFNKGNVMPAAVLTWAPEYEPKPPVVVEPPEQDLIDDAPPPTLNMEQREHNDPHFVRWLQQLMNERFGTTLVVDGDFGPATHAGVIRMQGILDRDLTDRAVVQDGDYGPKTANALAAWLSTRSG